MTDTSFADQEEIPVWGKDAVSILKSLGIVNGTGENRFSPNLQATRAQAITILINILEYMGMDE